MYRLGLKNMHKIWENEETGKALYLGDYYAATNTTLLKEAKIEAVLTAAASLGVDHSGSNINHKVYNAWDIPSYNISKHFDDAFEFIDSQLKNTNILVHCAAGISRSSTLVIMYLMKKKGWDLKKTLSYVKSKRSIVCPNYGFMRHLGNLQKTMIKIPNKQLKSSKVSSSNKIDEFKISSNFSITRQAFNKSLQKKVQIKTSDKGQIPWMSKSYSKPTSNTKFQRDLRPSSIYKFSSTNPISKRTDVPSWKKFLQSTQPVPPRIITIKP